MLHTEGTMAQAINYSAIAPTSDTAVVGHAKAISNFHGGGHRLVHKKNKTGTSTPASGTVTPSPAAVSKPRTTNGPQPLRLKPGQLFFGYEIKPLKNKDAQADVEQPKKQHFQGEGQSLRKKK